MIETIMYVGMGFLLAGLLVIGVIPLVHARAVRLTMRRAEALTPLSMAEIQADKDQLRAEFAMSTRRLEMSVEQMKAKTTGQLAEIGKKSEAVGKLKLELGEKTAMILELEANEKLLGDELANVQSEFAARTQTLEETRRTLADAHTELTKITGNFNEASTTADSHRIDLVAVRAQADLLKGQIETYDRENKDLSERLARESAEALALNHQLVEEHAKAEQLSTRVGELDRQLMVQTTEVEILTRRVEELVGRSDEQGRFLAEREYEAEQLRTAAAQFTDTESRRRVALETLQAEKTLVESQFRQSEDERGNLQRTMAGMKREAESAWATERMENAVLRERINDVAAEVARLTSALEGPGSAIDTILASETARPHANGNGHGAKLAAVGGGEASKGTLADRIRALQTRSSRVPQAS